MGPEKLTFPFAFYFPGPYQHVFCLVLIFNSLSSDQFFRKQDILSHCAPPVNISCFKNVAIFVLENKTIKLMKKINFLQRRHKAANELQ